MLQLANALLDGGGSSDPGLARAGAQLMAASACIGTDTWAVKVSGAGGAEQGHRSLKLQSHPLLPAALQVVGAIAEEVCRSVAEGGAPERRSALCLALGCVHRTKGGLALQVRCVRPECGSSCAGLQSVMLANFMPSLQDKGYLQSDQGAANFFYMYSSLYWVPANVWCQRFKKRQARAGQKGSKGFCNFKQQDEGSASLLFMPPTLCSLPSLCPRLLCLPQLAHSCWQ